MNIEEFKAIHNYEAATSVIKQYLDIKYHNIGCIVLFRLGDFYELFFDDAILVSKLLGLTLTKRSNRETEVPMCGIPYHSLSNYLPKIVAEGYKVAICEQTETPDEAKKRAGSKAVVRRDIVRIATSGTMFEENVLSDAPNYLMSLVYQDDRVAFCYVDISTLEIKTSQISVYDLLAEITRIDPREIIISQGSREKIQNVLGTYKSKFVSQENSYFALTKCQRSIQEYYGITSISALGQLTEIEVISVGSILQYLSLTQKNNLPQLSFPQILRNSKFMMIDAVTRAGLEIVRNNKGTIKGSLFDILNYSVTKSGARLFYTMLSAPLTDLKEITFRHNLIEFFKININLCNQIRELLKKIGDPERSLSRVSMNRAAPYHLLDLKNSIEVTYKIKDLLTNQLGLVLPPLLERAFGALKASDEIFKLINDAIVETDLAEEITYIKSSYHSRVQELCNLIINSNKIIDQLRLKYSSSTGIDNLKIIQNNVLGMFIEVSPKNASKIDDSFVHRQTTTTGIRFTTIELQNLEKDLQNAKSILGGLEKDIFTQVCQEIMQDFKELSVTIQKLSFLDVVTGMALLAWEKNYCKPEMSDDNTFVIKDARHPVVEDYLKSQQTSFTPNDISLLDKNIWLITGPNMSGKSTFLRQNAVIAIIAQAGFFVPASYAKIGIVDKVFSRIGASDDLFKGQSTFMVEMIETAAILAQSSSSSLIIIDELGRGTSTYDGVSIALSTLEYIHNKIKCRALFATHYHELATFAQSCSNVSNYHVSAKESDGQLIILHKIRQGSSDKSYGIKIAKLAGLPLEVIARAEKILSFLEQTKQDKNNQTNKDNNDVLEEGKPIRQNDIIEEKNFIKFQKIKEYVCNLDVDQITPRDALEEIFKIQELMRK